MLPENTVSPGVVMVIKDKESEALNLSPLSVRRLSVNFSHFNQLL
jgi:hypothetical protein